MRLRSLTTYVAVLGLATTLLTGCKKDKEEPVQPVEPTVGKLDVEFENVVGEDALVLNRSTPYTTVSGDPFTVSKFLYYVSNVKLTKGDGTVYAPADTYFLINQEEETSRHFTLSNIPNGDYTGLTFTVGVDSARNVSGAQEGALNPANNMFWTWNSGYINLKLEGNSSASTANASALTFHIGGFRKAAQQNTVMTVSPALPAGSKITIKGDAAPEVHILADVRKLFDGPNTIRFSSFNFAMQPGANSVKMAQNYGAPGGGMFKVEHVHDAH